MWELPGPGIEPVSPALAGEFLTTVLPGKSPLNHFEFIFVSGVRECSNYYIYKIDKQKGFTVWHGEVYSISLNNL